VNTFVVCLIRKRLKKEVTRWKSLVHPYFNKSGELSSFVLYRELRTVKDNFIQEDAANFEIFPFHE
jgi:hypothetical protein